MNKNYKIYLKGTLSEEGDCVQGLFHIKTDKHITPVKIGINNTFLKAWKLTGDANWGNVLWILGSLIAELMFLSNNVRDYIFLPNKYPRSFQDEKKGFDLLKTSLEEQINILQVSRGDRGY